MTNNLDLTGQIALVTGAARGLGAAITEALLKDNCKVSVCDVLVDEGQKLVDTFCKTYGEDKSIFIYADVTDDASFENAFKVTIAKFGAVSIVVNNAGILSEKNWERMIDVNVKGTIKGNLLAIKYLGRDNGGKGGHVVNTVSVSGLYPLYASPVYTASKYALTGFIKAFSHSMYLKQHGVLFSALCPASTDTPFYRAAADNVRSSEIFQEDLKTVDGLMSCSYVAEGVLMLLKESKTGSFLVVTPKEGYKFLSE